MARRVKPDSTPTFINSTFFFMLNFVLWTARRKPRSSIVQPPFNFLLFLNGTTDGLVNKGAKSTRLNGIPQPFLADSSCLLMHQLHSLPTPPCLAQSGPPAYSEAFRGSQRLLVSTGTHFGKLFLLPPPLYQYRATCESKREERKTLNG